MDIENEIFQIYEEIKEIENKINNLEELDYEVLHKYTDNIFKLKVKLNKLEKDSYLVRKPDLENNEIDLYLKNIHNKKDKTPDLFSYIITLHDTKTKIGEIDIRFSLLEQEKYLGNIGANIKDEYRGKRYSKKAFILLRNVMIKHGLKKPIFTVKENNSSSLKSLDAIGAKKVEYVANIEEPYYVYEYDLEEKDKLKK